MDELLDMIATDASPTDISDSIKDTLYAKAAERINSQRPDIAAQCLILQLQMQKFLMNSAEEES